MADLKKLEWEAKLLEQGVPADEVEYRRYREAKLLAAAADVQVQVEWTAKSAALMLEGLSVAEAEAEMADEPSPEGKLGEVIEGFYEELRHCTRFFENPDATDTMKFEAVAA